MRQYRQARPLRIYSPRMRAWLSTGTDCIIWAGVLMTSVAVILFFSDVLMEITHGR